MAHGKAWMINQKRCWPACKACTEAYEAYLRQQRIRKGMRAFDIRIDAARARERIVEMSEIYNVSFKEMAQRTGMADVHIGRIARGRTKRIYTSKARLILNLYREVVSFEGARFDRDNSMVDAHLSRLALQGLAAQGYSRAWIYEKTGIFRDTQRSICAEPGTPNARVKVRRETEAAILALAKEVGSTDGGNSYTKAQALARGWKPTMYHDALV